MTNVDPNGTSASSGRYYDRRIHPAQPAVMILIVCVLAWVNLYNSPGPALRAVTIFVAVGLLCLAFAAVRMYLYADDEGIAVRFIRSEEFVPWDEVASVQAVGGVRGSATVRITRVGGDHVDVPPSLLQPLRPTAVPKAMAQLRTVVREIESIRPS